MGATVTGVDAVEKNIKIARIHAVWSFSDVKCDIFGFEKYQSIEYQCFLFGDSSLAFSYVRTLFRFVLDLFPFKSSFQIAKCWLIFMPIGGHEFGKHQITH